MRIHVQRAIQRLKLFKLLSCTIPWHPKPVVNQMVRVGVLFMYLDAKISEKVKRNSHANTTTIL